MIKNNDLDELLVTFVVTEERFKGKNELIELVKSNTNVRGHTTYPTSTPGDITLYAHWDAVKISISFRANYPTSGVLSNPSARTRTYGLLIIYDTNYDGVSEGFNTFPDFLNRPDLEYEFVGWNTRADGNGTWYREGDILERTAALTLFAQWVLKP